MLHGGDVAQQVDGRAVLREHQGDGLQVGDATLHEADAADDEFGMPFSSIVLPPMLRLLAATASMTSLEA
jgi:hypothetical protein